MENTNLVDILDMKNYKFDTLLQKVYNIKKNTYRKNSLNNYGYYQVNLNKKTYFIHKLVYQIYNPNEDLEGYDIDHIDRDKLNNKIENLRRATRSDNNSNKIAQKNNTSGYKYISKTKWNTYRFDLTKNGIRYTKTFKNLEEVITYRDMKVGEICGTFTNLG
tara:strand:+ start:195 stop:680 length:486 start_codon:yes stop_codon:yes gene_type:complete